MPTFGHPFGFLFGLDDDGPPPTGDYGSAYWGPHFPDFGLESTYWGPHFPDGMRDPDIIEPPSPAGAGIFELTLEQGAQVTFAWSTGVAPFYDASEARASFNDDPAMRFSGSAFVVGSQVRTARARLARYASLGLPFQLGLPYEELTLRQRSPASTVYVHAAALARADWAVEGARVLVQHPDHGAVACSIQSVGTDSIRIDIPDGSPLGEVGSLGAVIMPTIAVFLDEKQGFARYPRSRSHPDDRGEDRGPIEEWRISARSAVPGFQRAALAARVALPTGLYSGLTVVARTPGEEGNAIAVSVGAGGPSSGSLTENPNTGAVVINYLDGVTTIADFIALFSSSMMVRIVGTSPDEDATLFEDADFTALQLTGGSDVQVVPVGIGATLGMYNGKPFWDRGLDVDNAIGDSITSGAKPQDFGGLPFNEPRHTMPTHGREVNITRELNPPGDDPSAGEWQWLKLFLFTVAGSWKSWWLPTWREDLIAVDVAPGQLIIDSAIGAGDLFAWYPVQRQHLHIFSDDDESVTPARISAAVDNLDGTITLDIVDEDGDPVTFDSAEGLMVSWLELVRWDKDEITVSFASGQFTMKSIARTIHQKEDAP